MHRSLIAVVAAVAGLIAGVEARADTAVATDAHFVDVHGAKTWVEVEGKGPPILFLHGGLQDFDNSFAAQRAFFANTRTVIGIDQIGHGHSPDDGRPFSYRRMADDTATIIERLGFGPVDVVGVSDGGDIALLLAHDHPTLVRRVVVTGANLRAGLPPDELERRLAWTDAQVAAKVEALEQQLPPRFRTDYQGVTPDGASRWPAFLIKSYRLWLTPVILEPSALKTIEAPVLVMAGDHDFSSIEETAEIFRGLPHGQLIIVPGAGHDTLGGRPALTNQAIREFLDDVPGR